jgi:TonB-linked SusC/RagA family outer membrane protein
MRKALLFVFALFFMVFSYEVSAQQRVVTGKVISDEDGLGLPGASILVKGTTVGTTTDLDGNFSINVPSGSNVLIFSFIGLKTIEENVGTRSVINVRLLPDAATLSEVVVTAIGIEKEKKALGYAVSTVGEQQIANRPEADVSRVLQGKVAGVNITATNGMSGSGTNIIIRGYSSATGSNQPLFVVDGVPFSSGTNASAGFTQGGAQTSSRFLDIDPNNIENVSVLKGLSATVLYGDQGRNGVILITTKSGTRKRKSAEVTINQSVFGNQAASLPTFGNEYGNGFQQQPGLFFSNYGPRLDIGLKVNHPIASSSVGAIRSAFPEYFVPNADGTPSATPILYDYKAYDDVAKVFFRTGLISNTSVQISGGSDRTSFNASFGYTDEAGFTPGNSLNKYNFGLGINSAVNDKLSINSSFTFARTDLVTPPVNAAFGSGPSGGIPSIFANTLYLPRNIDLRNWPKEIPGTRGSVLHRGGNDQVNPFWMSKNMLDYSVVDRFFNSTSLNYDVNDKFSITYRLGLDTYTENRESQYNKGAGLGVSALVNSGYYRTVTVKNTIWNQDLVFNYRTELSDKVGFSALLGANTRYDKFERNGLASSNQLAFGLFNHGNFLDASSRDPLTGGVFDGMVEEQRMGVYANVTLDYANYLFLNLSARNDWTSTVEPENRRILYPGASVSFMPFDAFNWSKSTINDLKLRLGYGTSAGFPRPYSTRNILSQTPRAFINSGGTLFQSQSLSTTLGNPNLKPELHEEVEFGIETAMLNNKLRFDISLYQKNTRNLITSAPIDPATGFTNTAINIGRIRNRGIEFQAIATPISRPSGFSWETIGNFTLYRSITMELGEGLEEIVVAGFTDLGNFAIPGKPFNLIKGTGFARTEDGKPIVLPTGDYETDAKLVELGDPNPRWNASWINTFRYKGFFVNAMWEYRHKGVIYSNTVTATLARGVTKDPVVDRELTFILPGVKRTPDGFVPNDIQVTASNYFFNQYHTGASESNVFDGSVIRLREVSLGYDIPRNLVSKTPFKRASIALSATNLWFKALNFPPNMNFDPDVLGTGVGNGLGFDFVTGPSSRRFGGTVNLTF